MAIAQRFRDKLTGAIRGLIGEDASTGEPDSVKTVLGAVKMVQYDSSGNEVVSSGGGTSATDDSAFTVGTTAVTPAGYLADETTPDSVDEGDVGAARMSLNRNVYVQIRDLSAERWAAVSAANALKVVGSAVTQPVSGTVATTAADGTNVAIGATSDAAVVTDTTGTLSGKIRGLVKWAFERMPASLGQKTMANSLPVVVASDQSTINVSMSQGNPTVTTVVTNHTAAATPTASWQGALGAYQIRLVGTSGAITGTGTVQAGNDDANWDDIGNFSLSTTGATTVNDVFYIEFNYAYARLNPTLSGTGARLDMNRAR